MNNRLTAKDRGLLKGAIRRAFARSELRRSVLLGSKTEHVDPNRPRVKTWYQCEVCDKYCAGHELQIDHIEPVIPYDKSMEEMTLDEIVARTWCEVHNLQVICIDPCHTNKTKLERKLRKELKNERKNRKVDQKAA